MTKTNEQIFAEIRKQGFITEQQIKLLKSRSQRAEEALWDDSLTAQFGEDGVPVTDEQGAKGLAYLRRWALKRNTPFGTREKIIVANATNSGFSFKGFHNFNLQDEPVNFQPVYKLTAGNMYMNYTPLGEPYVWC
jgi:hypothetical protein